MASLLKHIHRKNNVKVVEVVTRGREPEGIQLRLMLRVSHFRHEHFKGVHFKSKFLKQRRAIKCLAGKQWSSSGSGGCTFTHIVGLSGKGLAQRPLQGWRRRWTVSS